MDSLVIYLITAIIIIISALNCATSGLLGINFINIITFDKAYIKILLYLIILASVMYMLLNRTYYLPFLGKTVIPSSAFKPFETSDPSAKTITLQDIDKNAEGIIYWAANSSNNVADNPQIAYEKFSNYGVSPVVNGMANIKFLCPQRYFVTKFGIMNTLLNKHLHYRLIYPTGILSEIKTIDLTEYCK